MEKLQELEAWLQEHGVEWDARMIEFRIASAGGAGVFAKQAIAVDDVLCSIPKSAMLTVRTSSIAEVFLMKFGVSDGVALALALMYEIHLGKESRWHGYLQSLPALEPLPFTWPTEDAQLLQGTEIPEIIASDRERMRTDWETYIRPLTESEPKRFPPKVFSLAAYEAARTVTASRSFSVDDFHGMGMVPLADLFNHIADEHVHFTATAGDVCERCARPMPDDEDEEEENDAEEDCEEAAGSAEGAGRAGKADESTGEPAEPQGSAKDDSDAIHRRPAEGPCPLCRRDVAVPLSEQERGSLRVTMEAVRAAAPADEIFNTYGEKSNAALLQLHGFTLDRNPHDFVCLSGGLIARALAERGVKVPAGRLEVAAAAGLITEAKLDDQAFELSADAKMPWPRELLMLLNLIQAPAKVAKAAAAAVEEAAGVTVMDDDGELVDGALGALWVRRSAHPGHPMCQLLFSTALLLFRDVFSSAAASAGYTARPKAAAAGGEGPAEAEAENEDDIGFLLGAPVRGAVLAALALREAEYAGQPAGLARDRELLAQAVLDAAGCKAGSPQCNRMHALRLRVSERTLLQHARDVLNGYAHVDVGAAAASGSGAAGKGKKPAGSNSAAAGPGTKKRSAAAANAAAPVGDLGADASDAAERFPAKKTKSAAKDEGAAPGGPAPEDGGADGATAGGGAAAAGGSKLAAFKQALGGKKKQKKQQKEQGMAMTAKDDPVWSLFD